MKLEDHHCRPRLAPAAVPEQSLGAFAMRLFSILVFLLCGVGALGQPGTNQFRPFRAVVDSLRSESPQRQYDYFARLSKGLMSEDYAAFTGQGNVPHFGHLADELYQQKMYSVLRELMKGGEIESDHFIVIAQKFSREHDSETFRILLAQTEHSRTNTVEFSGEDIDACSAICLRYYLTDEKLGDEARSELITLLLHHGHPSVRAFAAESLATCHSPDVIAALQKATKDDGRVMTLQGPYDYVREYAEDALKKIGKNP
jgi:hypothetical protein